MAFGLLAAVDRRRQPGRRRRCSVASAPVALMLAGLAATASPAASSPPSPRDSPLVVAAQVLLGAGAGLYFPAGLQAVPVVAGAGRARLRHGHLRRRLLRRSHGCRRARCRRRGERLAHRLLVRRRRSPPRRSWRRGRSASGRRRARRCRCAFPPRQVLGLPTLIGAVGAVLPVRGDPVPHDVRRRPSGSSAPARRPRCSPSAGSSRSSPRCCRAASSDRRGPIASARRDRARASAPPGSPGCCCRAVGRRTPCAALFAGAVSSFFPVANIVAVDHFGAARSGARRLSLGADRHRRRRRLADRSSRRDRRPATDAARRRRRAVLLVVALHGLDSVAVDRSGATGAVRDDAVSLTRRTSDAEGEADGARVGGADDRLAGDGHGDHLLGARAAPTADARTHAARRRAQRVDGVGSSNPASMRTPSSAGSHSHRGPVDERPRAALAVDDRPAAAERSTAPGCRRRGAAEERRVAVVVRHAPRRAASSPDGGRRRGSWGARARA